MKKLIICIVPLLCLCLMSQAKGILVDNNIPAGNIVFERCVNDTVYVHQELRGSMKAWFYWAFRVKGAQGKTLTFAFTKSMALCERGPWVSLDKGKTWSYGAEKGSTKTKFTYTFPKNAREVWFSECHPYTVDMWNAFAKDCMKKVSWCTSGVICKSRHGRDVPFIRMNPQHKKPALSILLSARHHCSEAPTMFALQGLVSAFFEDSEIGEWLRENVALTVMPFVDMDGAVEGDQGKWRLPHDHNRDYTEFIYPETAALASLLAETKPNIFIDFHNPKLYKGDNFIYTPYNEYSDLAEESRFSTMMERYQEGGLNYKSTDDLPYGQGWNTASNLTQGKNCVMWAKLNVKSLAISRTIEVPFAYSNGALVTPEKLIEFGHSMSYALRAYTNKEQ